MMGRGESDCNYPCMALMTGRKQVHALDSPCAVQSCGSCKDLLQNYARLCREVRAPYCSSLMHDRMSLLTSATIREYSWRMWYCNPIGKARQQ